MRRQIFFTIFLIYSALEGIILLVSKQQLLSDFNIIMLHLSNLLLMLTGLSILHLQLKALHNPNPHVFVRSVMGGLMIKMAIFIIALIIYVSYAESEMNKYVVASSIGFYFVYLIAEVSVVMKQNKKKNA